MGAWAQGTVQGLVQAFEPERDSTRAVGMRKYMREQFPFLGIPTTKRRRLQKTALKGTSPPEPAELLNAARQLWDLDEREYQYAGTELLIRYERVLPANALPSIEKLITTKVWWDTVDGLASRVVGPMVQRYPELVSRMEAWAASENTWLARSAILHQLLQKERTDEERLFRYCLQRAGDREFFIRKAIGWALREYSKTAPEAVRGFVAEHEHELSPLSRREALLWLTGRPGSKRRTALEAAASGEA
ncbi:MAG: DNA alkylation repair protein [Dehalococcoidia bacterium]|nr:DNA alkylation repair protein [Dehalococcoidia bacterium]